jgi:hypothetical protein
VALLAARQRGAARAGSRTARLVVGDTQRSFCLLRHHGEYSPNTGVSPPSRGKWHKWLERRTRRRKFPLGQIPNVPRPSYVASGQDHPPLHQMERSSRMSVSLATSGSVGREDGNILTYPANVGIIRSSVRAIVLPDRCRILSCSRSPGSCETARRKHWHGAPSGINQKYCFDQIRTLNASSDLTFRSPTLLPLFCF